MSTSLGHFPSGAKWQFDAGVVSCFDDMLRRSIPTLDVMRAAVVNHAVRLAQPDTDIVDLGCSRGDSLALLRRELGDLVRYVGVESSAEFLDVCRERFAAEVADGRMSLSQLDLAERYPTAKASVTLAVLTLQFIPLECRPRLVENVFASTIPGGALIVVEKVLGGSPALDRRFVEAYYAMKAANGYSAEEIEAKRQSLKGVLVPLTAEWNERLLHQAGFAAECFWRWNNFAAWLALKPR